MTAYSWCSAAAEQQHDEARDELEAILRELEAMTAELEEQRQRLVDKSRRDEVRRESWWKR